MIFVSLKIYLRLFNTWLEHSERWKMWIVACRVFFLCWEMVGLAFSSSAVGSQARFILLEDQKSKGCIWVSSHEYPHTSDNLGLERGINFTSLFMDSYSYRKCWNSLDHLLFAVFIHPFSPLDMACCIKDRVLFLPFLKMSL